MIKIITKVPKTAQSTPDTVFQVTKTHIPQPDGYPLAKARVLGNAGTF